MAALDMKCPVRDAGAGGGRKRKFAQPFVFAPKLSAEGRKLAGFCLFDYQIGN
jgi:hypothetical protein